MSDLKIVQLYRATANRAMTLLEGQRIGHMELGEEGDDFSPETQSATMAMAFQSLETARTRPADGSGPSRDLSWLLGYRNSKRLWYPKAIQFKPRHKARGKHIYGYTEGLGVHFNAGRLNPHSTMSSGVKNGYAYDALGPDGVLLQANPLNEWGYHFGKSSWKLPNGKVVSGVSSRFRGVEISSAGSLDMVKTPNGPEYRPWFYKGPKDVIPTSRVRVVEKKANIVKAAGYEKYTDLQEMALVEYIIFLKVCAPTIFDFGNVVGHDEVAVPRGRKNDPGGALSITMPHLREKCADLYADLVRGL